MNAVSAPSPPRSPEGSGARFRRFGPALLLVLVAAITWWNGLDGPFVYDDVPAILRNPTVRSFWPPWAPLIVARHDLTVSGRPLANWTLALNHALGGVAPRGYHVANVAIHIVAALALFGFLRRTLRLPRLRARFGAEATPLALLSALLWLVHPLQTESVTYVIQRVESLMGACLLLTCYGFVRSTTSDRPVRWLALAVTTCFAGMASKEVMVVAPLLVLLFDRTFVVGSFAGALRARGRFYAALGASWLLLAVLVWATGDRGGSAGFGGAIAWWEYGRVQLWAVTHYLRLAFWPAPLVFDYGVLAPAEVGPVLLPALVVAGLLAATLVGVGRNHPLGFAGAWFVLILAPSSSILPVGTESAAEHRMYLPLAAVVVVAVLTVGRFAGRRAALVCGGLAIVAGAAATIVRNRDYRDPLALWSDTVAKLPGNARARNNLGLLLLERGDQPGALAQLTRAVELQPFYVSARANLGGVLLRAGRAAEALSHLEQALALEPALVDAQANRGEALLALKRPQEAIAAFEAAARLDPAAADVQAGLARAHEGAGRPREALVAWQQAVTLSPDDASWRFQFGNLLARTGDPAAAVAQLQRAHALEPENRRIANNLANAFLLAGRIDEAIASYEAILAAHPEERAVRENLEAARQMKAAR